MKLRYIPLRSDRGLNNRVLTGNPARGRWWVGNTPLSEAQTRVLLALMARPCATRANLVEMLWPDPDTQPYTANNVIAVNIFRLNHKIAGSGWRIAGQYDHTYRLERTGRIIELKKAA